jgi:adhesin transport system membrane fusion protein
MQSATPLQYRVMRGPRRAALLLLLTLCGLMLGGLAWANFAEVDELTRSHGRVVPVSEVQLVETLDGGVVIELLVDEGQQVEAGQVLLRIDDTTAAASLAELQEGYYGLLAGIARLRAETDGTALAFPEELLAARPDIAEGQRLLYLSRQEELGAAVAVLERQLTQRQSELAEMAAQLAGLRQQLGLVQKQYDLVQPLAASGAVSKVELLQLEGELAALSGEIARIEAALPRAEAAIAEAESRIGERRASFRAQALAELSGKVVELSALKEQMRGRGERVARTEAKAPVAGVVKTVTVAGVGAVVSPGETLVEIVPLGDELIVEAEIDPAEVAFVRIGQDARVRLTAYDFTRYGALPGVVAWISADTFVDEEGGSFYRVRVRTAADLTEPNGEVLPVLPGMVAEVDILTGRRTVLDYLLQPILRAQGLALSER